MPAQIIRTQIVQGSPLAPPHRLVLGASRVLATALIAGHAVVMVAMLLARPGVWMWWIVLLMPVMLVSLHRALGLHALRYAGGAVLRLEVRPDSGLDLLLRNGRLYQAEFLGSSTVHPWLVILNLRAASGAEGRRWSRSVIIVRDACDPVAFRRLRAWLRWGYRGPSDADAPPA